MFLKTFRSHFSYQSSIINMRANISRVCNPFIYCAKLVCNPFIYCAELPFEGLIALFYSELAFSKTKDLINIHLTSESNTIAKNTIYSQSQSLHK